MKKAGMALGITGGALSLLISIIMLFGLIIGGLALQHDGFIGEVINEAEEQIDNQDFDFKFNSGSLGDFIGGAIGFGFGIGFFFAIIGIIGGVLGLIGGIRIEKNNVVSGVFMCIGAVLTMWLFIPFVLLVIGGVFAFIQDKKPPIGSQTV